MKYWLINFEKRFAGLSVPGHNDWRYHFNGEILLPDRRDGDFRLFRWIGPSRQPEPSLSKGRQMVISRAHLCDTTEQLRNKHLHTYVLVNY